MEASIGISWTELVVTFLAIIAIGTTIWASYKEATKLETQTYDITRDRLLRIMGVEDGGRLDPAYANLRLRRIEVEEGGQSSSSHDGPKSEDENIWLAPDFKAPYNEPSFEARENKEREDRFTVLLVDYYAYGLSRAKSFSSTSLVMSIVGGIVLIIGVGSLLLQEQLNISIAGAAITTGSGILTNAISILFHNQANKALQHMQTQTISLRDDMKIEREARQAIQQIDHISDINLRDQLRAAVILRLAGAALPNNPAPTANSV